jgi:hypothetical protein
MSNIRETMTVEDGKLIIARSEDVSALLDANKALAEVAKSKVGHAAWRLVGRIPEVVAEQWAMECGAAVGTAEFMEYCKRKLMDGDNAKLLVKGF